MQYILYLFVLLMSLFNTIFPGYTWQSQDKHNQTLTFEVVAHKNLQQEKDLFVFTYRERYKDRIPLEDFEKIPKWFEKIENHIANPNQNTFLITVKRNNDLCGLNFCTLLPNNSVEIRELIIHPAYQGTGIGKQLLFSILMLAPSVTRIVLKSRKQNIEAHAFYTHLGFRKTNNLEIKIPEYSIGFEYLMPKTVTHTWQAKDKLNQPITFQQIIAGDLTQERNLLFLTFKERYKGRIPDAVLEPLLKEGFKKIEDYITHQTTHSFFITAKKDGELCGLIFFELLPENTVTIWEIIVHPSYQGCGIGKQLLFSIFKFAPTTKRIVLASRKENLEAHAFYERLGFKKTNDFNKIDVIGGNSEYSFGFEYNVEQPK